MNRLAPLHPSMPRRPDRTSQREPRRYFPPPRIFSRTECGGGVVREISTTTDRLHVRLCWSGSSGIRAFRFEVKNLPLLELALDRVANDAIKNVGAIPLNIGGWLDVSAGSNLVLFRLRNKKLNTRLEGAELEALRLAIEDLKTRGPKPLLEGNDE